MLEERVFFVFFAQKDGVSGKKGHKGQDVLLRHDMAWRRQDDKMTSQREVLVNTTFHSGLELILLSPSLFHTRKTALTKRYQSLPILSSLPHGPNETNCSQKQRGRSPAAATGDSIFCSIPTFSDFAAERWKFVVKQLVVFAFQCQGAVYQLRKHISRFRVWEKRGAARSRIRSKVFCWACRRLDWGGKRGGGEYVRPVSSTWHDLMSRWWWHRPRTRTVRIVN